MKHIDEADTAAKRPITGSAIRAAVQILQISVTNLPTRSASTSHKAAVATVKVNSPSVTCSLPGGDEAISMADRVAAPSVVEDIQVLLCECLSTNESDEDYGGPDLQSLGILPCAECVEEPACDVCEVAGYLPIARVEPEPANAKKRLFVAFSNFESAAGGQQSANIALTFTLDG